MIQIPTWKVYTILLVCLLGILYSLPNVSGQSARLWMQSNLPSWMPTKTVNLGLDLRGGAHLLYEVEVGKVIKDRANNVLDDLRKGLREQKIGYSRIGAISGGVQVVLKDVRAVDAARKILRGFQADLNISSGDDNLSVHAVFSDVERKEIYSQVLSQAIEVVRRRIDELGTTEPVIQRQGEDRILIQAPGADAEELKALVGETAQLSFHLVPNVGSAGRGGTVSYPYMDEPGRKLTISRRPIITGDMLDNAQPSFQDGSPVINFRLNSVGARKFCDVTRKNINKPFAIVLDREVLSAPVIRDQICGGSGVISGGFTVEAASNLSLLLRAGALPADMNVLEERTVGPSLGADSVQAGRIASAIGMVFVLVFMVFSYGLFGMFANIALFINMALIFALLSALQATLTLPGIAGIVLTIGMAVDANVLIFERIREEIHMGRSAISAIDAGYSRAMSTIVDSNLTTLIAAAILFSFGSGPIKGFSVTLGIGIITSFFSAIMVTRLLVIAWYRKSKPTELPV